MRGYSVYSIPFLVVLGLLPRSIENTQRLYFPTATIVADRMSPAFSAIEDAFIMDELVDKETPKEKSKVKLEGLKVSMKVPAPKLKKLSLSGETVGVAHFTDKFILKKNLRLVSAPRVVIEKPNNDLDEALLSSAGTSIEQVELPNGITLTKEVAKGEVKVAESRSEVRNIFAPRVTVGALQANTIAGRIKLQGDLIGENLTYYISRSLDGRVFETGVVDAAKNTFKMEVGNPKGLLQVELRSEKGEVLAYGEHVLNSSVSNLRNLELQIFPSEASLAGRVLSAADSLGGQEVAVEDAEKVVSGVQGSLGADSEGFFNEEIFERGSSFIVETNAKDYWSDLNFGLSGKPLYPRLINKKDFAEFTKTLDPFGEEVDVTSALVGSVTQNGLAQQNLTVKIFNYEYQKPIYFNDLGSANPRLEATTTNGGFIFTNLTDGGYLVQAYRGSKLVAQKWYLVREGHISQGQMRIVVNPPVVASAELFPRSRTEQGFVIHEMGAPANQIVKSTSEALFNTITTPGLMALVVDKSEKHLKHIYLGETKSRKRRFKVVGQEWLNSFLNARRSNANRAKPVVVGFLSKDFKIIKETSDVLTGSSQIFYFDKFGEVTDKGRSGGGFIITEASQGIGSVVLSIRGRETFLNKLVFTKPYSISVF